MQAYTSLKKISVIFTSLGNYAGACILSNGEVIKYHKFISVVVIELSVRCLNTGPEDRLSTALKDGYRKEVVWKPGNRYKEAPYGNK